MLQQQKHFLPAVLVSIISGIMGLYCLDAPDWENGTIPKIIDKKIQHSGTKAWSRSYRMYVTLKRKSPQLTFRWYKNDTLYREVDTLDLSPLNGSHMGRFFCIVSNGFGVDTSNSDTLKRDSTWSKPFLLNDKKILHRGSKATDSSLTLYVCARGDGIDPLKFEWFRNYAPLPGKFDSLITFASLQPVHNGVYYCKVSNSWGYETTLFDSIGLTDEPKAPKLRFGGKLIPQPLKPRRLDSFGLRASVESAVAPFTNTWFKSQKGDTTILLTVKDTVFMIHTLDYSDTGRYWMICANTDGADTSLQFQLTYENYAPHWFSDTLHATVAETAPFSWALSDSCKDPEGDPVKFFLKAGIPDGDTLTADGRYLFTPKFGDAGHYKVQLSASDGILTSSAVLTLNVRHKNRSPQFLADLPKGSYALKGGQLLSIPFKAIDPDNDKLTYSCHNVTLPRPATVILGDSMITWQSTAQDSGIYSLELSASDAESITTVRVVIGIGSTNLPPRITIQGISPGQTIAVKEQQMLQFVVVAQDPDQGDSAMLRAARNLPFTLSHPLTNMYDTSTGLFRFTPDFALCSKTSPVKAFAVTFFATDRSASRDSFLVTIIVSDSNRVVQWSKDTLHGVTAEAQTFIMTLADSCSDADGDSISFNLADGKPAGDVITADGRYVYTPGSTDAGTYTVVINASDGVATRAVPLKLKVLNSNRKPAFEMDLPKKVYHINEGETLVICFKATDADGDSITYALGKVEPAISALKLTATLTAEWKSAPGDSGLYSIELLALDGMDTGRAVVSVGVGYVNLPPEIFIKGKQPGDNLTVKEAASLRCTLAVSDQNTGDVVTRLSPRGLPVGSIYDTITGIFAYAPGFAVSTGIQNTVFSAVTFYARDNGTPQLRDSFMVNLTVLDSNSAPVWKSASARVTGTEGRTVTFAAGSVFDKDNEGDPVAFTVSKGTITATADRVWSWTPDFTSHTSPDSIVTVTAADNHNPPAQSPLHLSLSIADSTPAVTLAQPLGATYNSIRISWTPSNDQDFSAYKVFYGTAVNVTELSLPGSVTLSRMKTIDTVRGLAENMRYYIRVFVYNNFGSVAGSNEVSTTTPTVNVPVLTVNAPVLTRDSGFVVEALPLVSGTAAAAAGIQSVTGRVDGGVVLVSGTADWNFSIAAASKKAWHSVEITVTDSVAKTSSRNFQVFVRPSLATPAKITASSAVITSRTISFTWNSVPYCDRYLVYRSANGINGSYTIVKDTGYTGFKDTLLQIGKEYWYKIRGYYALAGGVFSRDTTAFSEAANLSTRSWFERTYDLGVTSSGNSIQQTRDGGYIVTGSKSPNMLLLKLNSTGDTQWTRTLVVAQAGAGYKVRQTQDNGFVIATSGSSAAPPVGTSYSTKIIKTNSSGDETGSAVWRKNFTQTNTSFGVDVVITADNGYFYFLGGTLYKLPSGDTTATWSCASLVRSSVVLLQNSDSKFIEIGTDASDTLVITRIASNGTRENYRKYGFNFHASSCGQAKALTNSNEYIVSGESSLVLFRELDTVWTRRHAGVNCQSVVPITDGYACAGSSSNAGYFFKTDILGQKIAGSERSYKGGSSIYSIQKTSDGGFILCGSYNGSLYVVKTDSNGATGE